MNVNKLIKENIVVLLLFVSLLNYGFVHFCVLPGHFAAAALQDYGFISVLTIFCILSGQLFSLWNFAHAEKTSTKAGALILAYILQVYLMREADLHHFWTSKSVTSLKFFMKPEYPLAAKIIAGPILILFFICFGYILLRYSWFTLKAFFRGEPWAVAVGFWGTLLVTSQVLDRMKFPDDPWRIKLIEEYMEFCASTYLPTAMILFIRGKKKKIDSENKQ